MPKGHFHSPSGSARSISGYRYAALSKFALQSSRMDTVSHCKACILDVLTVRQATLFGSQGKGSINKEPTSSNFRSSQPISSSFHSYFFALSVVGKSVQSRTLIDPAVPGFCRLSIRDSWLRLPIALFRGTSRAWANNSRMATTTCSKAHTKPTSKVADVEDMRLRRCRCKIMIIIYYDIMMYQCIMIESMIYHNDICQSVGTFAPELD